jgi:hypothetical protein
LHLLAVGRDGHQLGHLATAKTGSLTDAPRGVKGKKKLP